MSISEIVVRAILGVASVAFSFILIIFSIMGIEIHPIIFVLAFLCYVSILVVAFRSR